MFDPSDSDSFYSKLGRKYEESTSEGFVEPPKMSNPSSWRSWFDKESASEGFVEPPKMSSPSRWRSWFGKESASERFVEPPKMSSSSHWRSWFGKESASEGFVEPPEMSNPSRWRSWFDKESASEVGAAPVLFRMSKTPKMGSTQASFFSCVFVLGLLVLQTVTFTSVMARLEHRVFLSFRGGDTRFGFTGHLYDGFCRKGFRTFMDDEELRRGETIQPQIRQAIQNSSASVVVLSENYAGSTWCLDELVNILECWEEKKQFVVPIFYKVAPSDVRYQRNCFERNLAIHAKRFGCDSDKVQKWRSALSRVAEISGYHLREDEYKFKLIQDIVSTVNSKVSMQLHKEQNVVGQQFRRYRSEPTLKIHRPNIRKTLPLIRANTLRSKIMFFRGLSPHPINCL